MSNGIAIWEGSNDEARREWIVTQDYAFQKAVRRAHRSVRYDTPVAASKTAADKPRKKPTVAMGDGLQWKRIIAEVAEKHRMTIPMLLAKRRHKPIVDARREMWHRMYQETTLSLPEIGRRTGGFDHSTVLNSIRRVTEDSEVIHATHA